MNLKPFSITVLLLLVQYTTGFAQANLGFVQHEAAMQPVQTDAAFKALPLNGKQTSRIYYDGLGREVQQVAVQASPLQNDIIQPLVYDNLGRQTMSYLPYAGKSTDVIGSYRASATTDQAAFYNNGTADKVADDNYPYSQQVFENSPLQRLLSVGKVGNGFQPTVSGNHYKTVKYRYNSATADGNILTWNADGTFTAGTYYADNTLSVTDGIDEDNVETLSYADIAGRTILKRQILSGGNLDTYYIYNLAGAISYVVPPKATTLLSANSYNLSVAPLSNLVFKYLYDARGRIIEKTVPAKGKMVIVYDPLNRPVLLQDANMALVNKWNYIKYDSKNRTISQGIYLDNTNIGRANMQTYVSGLAIYNTTWFENRSGTVVNSGYYTNSSFPTTGIMPLAYAYFDNYDLNQDGAADFTYTAQGLSGEGGATTAPLKGVPTVISQTTVGAGLTNTLLTKVTFYDKRGNAIQVKSNNQVYYTGATALTDTKTIVPNFNGTPQVSLVVKKSSATVSLTVQTNLSYDHMYRVTAVDQKYNGATAVRVAAYNYNELGQATEKNLGSTNAGNTTWLQSVDMRYNIRGQLLSINNSKLSNDGIKNDDSNDLFGIEMLYDQADVNLGNTKRYNGNLSGVKWMSRDATGTAGNERAYKYLFDGLNRYISANYIERATAATGAFDTNSAGFSENGITYDEGGNILTLKRNTITTTGSITGIDNLTYTYDNNNPNQLKSVTDLTGTNYVSFGFRNMTGTTTGNYTYDVNGNLTADPYKGLTLGYNVLNRTDKITVTTSTGRYINYTYGADGTLVRKQAYDNNTLGTTTDYVDGLVYLNGVISYFAMPEGRVRNTGSGGTVTLKQEYVIADQQGNARISFEDNGSAAAVVRQENSYYGFGLSLANSPVATPVTDNKRLYNGGSEWQNDYGNLPDLQQTFYRNYDAALGRWIAVDPEAESAESMTVYQYSGNNPIMMNDPLGDLSQAQWDFVLDQLNNGIDGNYFLKDGQGGGGGSEGSLYTKLSDMEAFASVADRIDNGSIRGGWGATAAGSFQAAFNNFTNGIPASGTSDINHQIPLTEASIVETRIDKNWLIDRLNNANQGPSGYVPAGGVPPDDGFLDDYLGTGSKINAVRSVLSWLADNVKITKAARIGEIVNVPLFLSAEVMDYYAWKNNKISGAKALVNLGMGLIGFSDYGAPISLVYFGVDAFYDGGWEGLGNDISNGVNNAWGQLTQGLNQYNSNIYQWVPHQ